MDTYIPLFPLHLVVFPEESLNLHIFEPRYKELLQDVLVGNRRFGVVSYINDEIAYGTEVEVKHVVRVYPDGRMDIRTQGLYRFRIQDFYNPLPGKPYAGGSVEYLSEVNEPDPVAQAELEMLVSEFFQVIQASPTEITSGLLNAYSLAHRIGLSAEQKYELLKQSHEYERQRMVIAHLQQAIPLLKNVEGARARIRMNGHFRHFDPLDF